MDLVAAWCRGVRFHDLLAKGYTSLFEVCACVRAPVRLCVCEGAWRQRAAAASCRSLLLLFFLSSTHGQWRDLPPTSLAPPYPPPPCAPPLTCPCALPPCALPHHHHCLQGSVVRAIRRLEELLRQLAGALRTVGDAELADHVEVAIAKIRRGVPFAPSLCE